jgi:hypothetical protein
MRQGISSFHRKLDLFYMFHTQSFPANNANTHSFTGFVIFKAIVAFQHKITSTYLIKQAILFQGFMAGNADNSFYVFNVRFQLNRIFPFPGRSFFMNEVFFANPFPTYNTNSNSICTFAFSGAFIAFHCFISSGKYKIFIY